MKTEQLHDHNEELWPNKLHLGCGDIYLRGYKNIDVYGELSDILSEKELLAHSTTICEYYRKEGSWDALPERDNVIVDERMRMQSIEYEYPHGSVDKIIAVQSMEYMDPIDFITTLDGCLQALRSPGVLIVSVPDMDGTLDWLEDPKKVAFVGRHLRGAERDKWSFRRSWWTYETLYKAFEWVGFNAVQSLPNFHVYPSIVMKGQKIA